MENSKSPPRSYFLPDVTIIPGLYIVATPIGNISDITLRALATLIKVSTIACEDTRVTKKLLDFYDIETPYLSYHEHNANQRRPEILDKIHQGHSVALVSDAGMPLISDPGYKLIRDCIQQDIPITCLPGPTASLTGLVLSGAPPDRFMFMGFLPDKKAARLKVLQEIQDVQTTLIFYESPKRLIKSLDDISEVLKDRPVIVARELTKYYEEMRRGLPGELKDFYEKNGIPKGEAVLVIHPPGEKKYTIEEIEALLKEELKAHSLKDAATHLATKTGWPRREIYNRGLESREASENLE